MAETTTVKATCLCGSTAQEITIPTSALPLPVSLCHCDSCRHMTGTLGYSCTYLPATYKPSQELLAKHSQFQFSERLIQYFCRTCGAFTIQSNKEPNVPESEQPTQWDAITGYLEKFDGLLELQKHIFVKDSKDGGLTHFLPERNGKPLPCYTGYDEKTEQLPRLWSEPETTRAPAKSSDRLHAHCKCKGVEFWIARPMEQPNGDEGSVTESDRNYGRWLREDGTKYVASNCFCNSCRLASGLDIMQWTYIPTSHISLDSQGKEPFKTGFGTLKTYKSSPGVTRYFCSTCGATVFYWDDDRPQVIDVAVGLLDAPEGSRAEDWLAWRTGRVSYRKDAIGRAESLLVALEAGLEDYGQTKGVKE